MTTGWTSDTAIIALVLVGYQLLLVAVGLWARRRTRNENDFYLAGQGLGPWVASLSASASSSSAWTLLGVSGAAFAWGAQAWWLLPATVLGFVLNWCWVAPRLFDQRGKALTLSALLAPSDQPAEHRFRLSAAAMILFAFTFYISAQFQAAGNTFAAAFDMQPWLAISLGAGVIALYSLLGGFWAVSLTDALQGLLMAACAIVLPLLALHAVGGIDALASAMPAAGFEPPADGVGFWLGLGLIGIALGYPGQPHVVNRYMALQGETALRRGRIIAIVWALIIYTGMILLGLCARVLLEGAGDSEQVLFEVTDLLLPPVLAAIVFGAVLSAIMSTADSQLLVAGAAIEHDSRKQLHHGGGLGKARLALLLMTVLATCLAIFAPQSIFDRVLFAWHAIGSALGPVLLVRLCRRRIVHRAALAALWTGFAGTVALSLLPNTPGDMAERYLPFLAALAIAWWGSVRDSKQV